jgi:hypothetical protein
MGLNEVDIRRILWTAAQAFLAVFLVAATGALSAPNLGEAKAALLAGAVAGLAAALSALKNLVLPDSSTLK